MSDPARPLADRRVLVLEDEYLIAMDLKGWLQDAGASVVGPAPKVKTALELIERDAPDAAVLDVNLGEGSTAYPVADRLSALGVPFLFATGDVRRIDHPAHRGRPRLAKPYREADVVRAVAGLLG